MMEGDSFRMAWNEACLQAGLPSISLDTAARILAVLHIESGCTTAVAHSPFRRGAQYIYTGGRGACGPSEVWPGASSEAGGLCRGWEVCRVPGVGAYRIRPPRRPDRDGCQTHSFGPTGPSNRANAGFAPTRTPQNPPGFTPKRSRKPEMTLGLGQKQDLSPRRGSFHAKNRI